ncbi:hypothetical protein ARMSODRAFT_1015015 [Armillaria solidipes]|uniref:Uncharacterized protein n=1 Tax=Armillaria solidipes TaxID=1076256 RepID=A0A2H3BRC5_9AGAR|nr:hypothetical protein ARMSODRAFT_1015015 [Armillaria solidipes]
MSIKELRWFQFTLTKATDFQHLAKILQLTSRSLRVLLLTFKCPRRSPLLPELPIIRIGHLRNVAFTSNQLPALQSLDIELGTAYRWNPAASPEWSELDQILSSPPFDERFQMLTIKVHKRQAYKISREGTTSRRSSRGQRARYRASAVDIMVEDMVSQLEAQFPRLAGKLGFSVKEY